MHPLLRRFLLMSTLVATLPTSVLARNSVTDAEVAEIGRDAILIDTHDDVTSKTVDGYDIATPNRDGNTDLARMRTGHLGAEFFAVYVDPSYVKDNHPANRALQMIDTVRHDIIDGHPQDFVFATTADDIERAHREHKIAALMGIEGGHAIEDSLRLLRDYYVLQLRKEFKSQVPPATLQDVVAQIDHAVKVGGIDAVGIGTDFDGVACTPPELDGYDKFPTLTRALLEKGYTPNDVRKIYGGNLLRVMRAVERQAADGASFGSSKNK
jgi:microsomal dipeptidase-like Zn-dependent dipeptidase